MILIVVLGGLDQPGWLLGLNRGVVFVLGSQVGVYLGGRGGLCVRAQECCRDVVGPRRVVLLSAWLCV